MEKDDLFALIPKAELLWEGPLTEIWEQAKHRTGINLQESQPHESGRDQYKTVTKIDNWLFVYDASCVESDSPNCMITSDDVRSKTGVVRGMIYRI